MSVVKYFVNSLTHCGTAILRFLKETTVNLCLCQKGKERPPNRFRYRFSGPLPLVTLWPRTSIVRNPTIPARALLPRETGICGLGALATEVQKQHKGAII